MRAPKTIRREMAGGRDGEDEENGGERECAPLFRSQYPPLDVDQVRSCFPSLSLPLPGQSEDQDEGENRRDEDKGDGEGKEQKDRSGFIFADNAGGTQIAGQVLPLITDYLVKCNVQLGGSYHHSQAAAHRVQDGVDAVRAMVNAAHADEIVVGPNGTQLAENLARALEGSVHSGDEIIVTDLDHEGK